MARFPTRFLVALTALCGLAALSCEAALGYGAVGDLTLRGCISVSAGNLCFSESPGLHGARAVATSPDGRSVYVVASTDGALVAFDRDLDTGAVTARDCFSETTAGCVSAPGTSGATAVAISPDGKSVYVTSNADDAVAVFSRDLSTTQLSFSNCIEAVLDECGSQADGLDGANAIEVSADGKSVYVTASVDDALVSFDRSPSTGALTNSSCFRDDAAGSCEAAAPGLNGADDLAISPDGTSVYAVSAGDRSLVAFDRDPSNGALSNPICPGDSTLDCTLGGGYLPTAVAVSPDGKQLYVAQTQDEYGRLAEFDRDPSTGELSAQKCIARIAGDCQEFETPVSLTFSSDGRSLYVTEAGGFDEDGNGYGRIAHYQRDPALGTLSGLRRNHYSASAVALSPDGNSFYAVAFEIANDFYDAVPGANSLISFDRRQEATDPGTALVAKPQKKTTSRTAEFRFSSTEPDSTFKCRLDRQFLFRPCASPKHYAKLRPGKHTFAVFAVDAAGNHDRSPAMFRWTIAKGH